METPDGFPRPIFLLAGSYEADGSTQKHQLSHAHAMEWRDGKLHIGLEDQADILRDLCAFATDGESRANLRKAARDCSVEAADQAYRPEPIPHVSLGGRGVIRRDSTLGRLWS